MYTPVARGVQSYATGARTVRVVVEEGPSFFFTHRVDVKGWALRGISGSKSLRGWCTQPPNGLCSGCWQYLQGFNRIHTFKSWIISSIHFYFWHLIHHKKHLLTSNTNFSQCLLSNEDSFANVGQVIACSKFFSFLTPDMASKNDASYGIG